MTDPDVKAYQVQVRRLCADDGGGWVAEIPSLPGCMGDGETAQDAIEDCYRAALEWIDATVQLGRSVPPPSSESEFSGQWRIRMPKTLHRRLSLLAGSEGVSLNTLATTLLAEALGGKDRPHPSQHPTAKDAPVKRGS